MLKLLAANNALFTNTMIQTEVLAHLAQPKLPYYKTASVLPAHQEQPLILQPIPVMFNVLEINSSILSVENVSAHQLHHTSTATLTIVSTAMLLSIMIPPQTLVNIAQWAKATIQLLAHAND